MLSLCLKSTAVRFVLFCICVLVAETIEQSSEKISTQGERTDNEVGFPSGDSSNSHLPSFLKMTEDDDKLPYFFILHLPKAELDNEDNKPLWSEWSEWSDCTGTCGTDSRRFRHRECLRTASGPCMGESIQWSPCQPTPCLDSISQEAEEKVGLVDIDDFLMPSKWKRKREEHRKSFPNTENHFENVKYFPQFMTDKDKESEYNEKEIEKDNDTKKLIISPQNQETRIEAKRQKTSPHPSFMEWTSRADLEECKGQSPYCPMRIQLRRRWCYLSSYCVGEANEIRICGPSHTGFLFCGNINTSNFTEFNRMKESASVKPLLDPRIGWSTWTAWSPCASDCGYRLLPDNNSSVPSMCQKVGSKMKCTKRRNDFKVCSRQKAGNGWSLTCGLVERTSLWKISEKKDKKVMPSSSRALNMLMVLIILTPPVILLFYCLLSKSQRTRYEPLPSQNAGGCSNNVSTPSGFSTSFQYNRILGDQKKESWQAV